MPHAIRSPLMCVTWKKFTQISCWWTFKGVHYSGAQKPCSSPPSWGWSPRVSTRPPTTPSWSATSISGKPSKVAYIPYFFRKYKSTAIRYRFKTYFHCQFENNAQIDWLPCGVVAFGFYFVRNYYISNVVFSLYAKPNTPDALGRIHHWVREQVREIFDLKIKFVALKSVF